MTSSPHDAAATGNGDNPSVEADTQEMTVPIGDGEQETPRHWPAVTGPTGELPAAGDSSPDKTRIRRTSPIRYPGALGRGGRAARPRLEPLIMVGVAAVIAVVLIAVVGGFAPFSWFDSGQGSVIVDAKDTKTTRDTTPRGTAGAARADDAGGRQVDRGGATGSSAGATARVRSGRRGAAQQTPQPAAPVPTASVPTATTSAPPAPPPPPPPPPPGIVVTVPPVTVPIIPPPPPPPPTEPEAEGEGAPNCPGRSCENGPGSPSEEGESSRDQRDEG